MTVVVLIRLLNVSSEVGLPEELELLEFLLALLVGSLQLVVVATHLV